MYFFCLFSDSFENMIKLNVNNYCESSFEQILNSINKKYKTSKSADFLHFFNLFPPKKLHWACSKING